jgi:hypothetical protein
MWNRNLYVLSVFVLGASAAAVSEPGNRALEWCTINEDMEIRNLTITIGEDHYALRTSVVGTNCVFSIKGTSQVAGFPITVPLGNLKLIAKLKRITGMSKDIEGLNPLLLSLRVTPTTTADADVVTAPVPGTLLQATGTNTVAPHRQDVTVTVAATADVDVDVDVKPGNRALEWCKMNAKTQGDHPKWKECQLPFHIGDADYNLLPSVEGGNCVFSIQGGMPVPGFPLTVDPSLLGEVATGDLKGRSNEFTSLLDSLSIEYSKALAELAAHSNTALAESAAGGGAAATSISSTSGLEILASSLLQQHPTVFESSSLGSGSSTRASSPDLADFLAASKRAALATREEIKALRAAATAQLARAEDVSAVRAAERTAARASSDALDERNAEQLALQTAGIRELYAQKQEEISSVIRDMRTESDIRITAIEAEGKAKLTADVAAREVAKEAGREKTRALHAPLHAELAAARVASDAERVAWDAAREAAAARAREAAKGQGPP